MPAIDFIYFIICLWTLALVASFALTSKHGITLSRKSINGYYMTKAFFHCGKKGVRDFKKQLDQLLEIDRRVNPEQTMDGLQKTIAESNSIDKLFTPAAAIARAEAAATQSRIDMLLQEQAKLLDAIHMAQSINCMKIHGIEHAEVVAVIKDSITTMTPYQRKKIIEATHCFHDGKNLFFVTDEKKVIH